MPFVPAGQGLDLPSIDLDDLAARMGDPPWRAMLVGTGGTRVVLLRWPAGFATVPHVHPGAEEIFLVLAGRALFAIGDEPSIDAGPGTFLFAPRGVLHAIRVPDGETLTLLASVAPNEDRDDETVEHPDG
jgi:mannose-6-phosphate isomerase-like protein (cupin superfamily)